MQPVPRIFVSATSRDLRTARGLVAEGLRRMECLPIVQDDFPPDYKTVRDMLREKIRTCNAVVHIAGFYYGAEPQPVIPGPDRRSFTQMEYEIAVELKLPCYVFLCERDFPFDPSEPETPDKAMLQLAHRERLLKRDELYYELNSPEELGTRTRELQLSVEELRKELAREANRRRLAMGAAVAALVIALGGGAWLLTRQASQDTRVTAQESVNTTQSSDIAALKAQLEGPWAVVNKVNAATDLLRPRLKDASDDEIRAAAIHLVATDLKKTPDEIRQLIDSATALAEKLIATARTEAQADPAQRDANRAIEADTLVKLADSHKAAAKYREALAAYNQALPLLDPKSHPVEWMDCVTSIADVEDALGQSAAAADRNKEALAFAESNPALGIGHDLTIYATSNLAIYYQYEAHDLPAAEALMRRVLKARRDQLGAEDPATLRAMGALAEILAARQQFDEAAGLSGKALEAADRVFGPDDEVTIDIVDSLARIYDEQDNLEKAIKLSRRVVAFREKTLGADDDYTVASQFVLADMLKRNDELEEAASLLQSILDHRTETLGPEHPDTLDVTESVASVLAAEKDYKGAEKLLRSTLATRQKVQGPDHPDTWGTTEDLAGIYWDQEKFAEAEPLYRAILASKQKTLPADSPDITSTLYDLAGVLHSQEKYAEAEPLYRTVLKNQEATLPAGDPQLADTCYQLAVVLQGEDKNKDALVFAKRALAIGQESLPADDEALASYKDFVAELSQ